ncbi:MAG: aspartate-semialdehyde dehydrogenase [Francisellaceae bacterium]|nr:aspartate-semialdehyde dehydrogenase [Francisellaceae bacterium]
MKTYDIAVLGATGTIGEAILSILEERNFPIRNLYPLATKKSEGDTLLFKNKPHWVQDVETFDFSKAQVALFSAGSHASRKYVPRAVEKGCIVIDNTSCFRYEEDVPLVITEVNKEKIAEFKNRLIIANPNCSTMQLLVALNPIYQEVGIKRINIATYQSVSGTGRRAIKELASQTTELLNGRSIESSVYTKQIAFNVLPHIDDFLDNGYTKEEMKLVWETQKIWQDKEIRVNATAVRVPVFFGHSEAVHLETQYKITANEVKALLKDAPGVKVLDDLSVLDYPTPVLEGAGGDDVFVGRIREDISHPLGLNLWIVADNTRKGGALNSIQILEELVKDYL